MAMFKFLDNPKVKKFREGGSLLTILTVIGVVIGVALGLGLRETKDKWTPREVIYLKFIGDLFLRTLSALILPLIVSSLIDAVGSLDLTLSKKIGIRALLYYLGTTAIAAILGLVLGMSIQPGSRTDFEGGEECKSSDTSTVDTILDLIRNAFPNNLVGATIELSQTNVLNPALENSSIPEVPFNDRKIELIYVRGTNMMGLVIFSMVLGVTLGQLGEAGKPVLLFFRSLGEATMKITSMVVSFSPVAICFLVAGQLVEQDDIVAVFENIGWYFGTVLIGLLLHGFIILPLTYIVLARKSPIRFFLNMFQAMATAFGTASSSATLPVTMKCLEEKNNVDTRVSRFVIPIGATVNMNGTALYLPVGAIYIAQLCGITLSIGQLISISLISIATSIGAAGIPQVGMVIIITVLNSVGLPTEYVAYIMPVDWLLERFRTAVNVMGDSFGAGIVDHMSKGDLAKIDREALAAEEQGLVFNNNSRKSSIISKHPDNDHIARNGMV